MSVKLQRRPAGEWETSRKRGLYRRLTLRRADGQVYLNRWGFGHDRVGGVLLHRMDAPDPGVDLHDHPWTFISIVLAGGYVEQRTYTRVACQLARAAATNDALFPGLEVERRRWSVRRMGLNECHTITALVGRPCWTLVLRGPRRQKWGFYLPGGYLDEAAYDATVRAERRDLWSDQNAERPW